MNENVTIKYLTEDKKKYVLYNSEGKKVKKLFKTKNGTFVRKTINYVSKEDEILLLSIIHKGERLKVVSNAILEN